MNSKLNRNNRRRGFEVGSISFVKWLWFSVCYVLVKVLSWVECYTVILLVAMKKTMADSHLGCPSKYILIDKVSAVHLEPTGIRLPHSSSCEVFDRSIEKDRCGFSAQKWGI
jgi:hypothetical protein